MNIRALTALLALAFATGACQPEAREAGETAAAVDTTAILASIDTLRSAYEQVHREVASSRRLPERQE